MEAMEPRLQFIEELLKEVEESKKDGQINHHTDSVRIMVALKKQVQQNLASAMSCGSDLLETDENSLARRNDKVIVEIMSRLNSSPLPLPSKLAYDLSCLCTQVISHPKVLPLVELLLMSPIEPILNQPRHYDLDERFLENVTKQIYNRSDCHWEISTASKIHLWSIYLPSFQQEVANLLSDSSKCDDSSVSGFINNHLPKELICACMGHPHLEHFLKDMLSKNL